MAQDLEIDRQSLSQQLSALTDVCTCRLQPACRALMAQLAYRGVIPTAVLTMTDQEWLDGCSVLASRVQGS